MRDLFFTKSAIADIDGHIRYLEDFNQYAADRLLDRLSSAMATLSLFPFAGRDLGGRRKFPVPGTRLVLVYRLRGDDVQVTRCFDGRTNWSKQLQREK